MVALLRVIGWLGTALSTLNGELNLFANDETALRYAGPGRDLDLSISVASFCLLFLALAAILEKVRRRKMVE